MRDQIDEVKAKTDIVGLISLYIDLKKAGRNFKANCPFHAEKTPSFMVSPELQSYKCFGCGESGDAFTFLEKYEGMEFGEALRFLAQKAGVKLAPMSFKSSNDKEKIFEVNELCVKFYHYVLVNHKAGSEALDYLIRERGLKKNTIETFNLGFSPNMPFAASKFLIDKHKVNPEDLVKAGIVYKKGRNLWDRFRGRIIFPLYDHRGNVIGFAGRILPKDKDKDLAKYINTPETIAYHKGSVLYGLNLTRSEIKRANSAVVVEGELDLISTFVAGIKNVVALKGTAMTEDQVRLLARYAQKLVIALDADLAGDSAARRGITLAANLGLEVRVVELKKYKDPDEAAREDPEYFKKSFHDAVSVWDFFIDSVMARYNISSGEGKTKISREICPILAGIENEVQKAHYAKVVADKLEVPVEAVINQINQTGKKAPIATGKYLSEEGLASVAEKTRRERLEERFLALYFQADPVQVEAIEIPNFKTPKLVRIIRNYNEFKDNQKKFNLSKFSDSLPAELKAGFSDVMLTDLGKLTEDPEKLKKELLGVVRELATLDIKENLSILAKEMKKLEAGEEREKLSEVEGAFTKLTAQLTKLEK